MKDELLTNPDYLKKQYADSGNLHARQKLHEKYSTNTLKWHPWVFDQLSLNSGDQVLELGCGPGNLWFENAERLPPGSNLYLTDYSQGMLRKSRENLQKAGIWNQFAGVDACHIPFASNVFDVVVANHMLYHVADLRLALGEISRILKPEGRFFAATNGEKHMFELWQLVQRFLPHTGAGLMVGDFTLQKGAEQVSRIFPETTVVLFEGSLQINESLPVLDYLLSTRFGNDLRPVIDQVDQVVSEIIKQDGAFRIQTQSGKIKAHN